MVMSRVASIVMCPLVVCLVCLSGCSTAGLTSWRKTATQTPQAAVTIVPTTTPQKEMTICLGEEPDSLYLYAQQQSVAMWSILEAVYDGPIDVSSGKYKAVILQKLPTFEDGDLAQTAIPVVAGDLIVDSNNHIVVLETGVSFLPSGCKDSSCSTIWDGVSEIQMDQVSATFKLRTDLLWSDGTPLTAADSLFSFSIDSDPETTGGSGNVDLTYSYEVLDNATLQWKSLPGFNGIKTQGMFWTPLPKHQLENLPVSDLENSELAAKHPLGWGPYVITEWESGDHISLIKNNNYFRSDEGLPAFDRLTYRFVEPDAGGSLAALASGQCDLVEQSSNPQEDLALVTDLLKTTDIIAEWKTKPEITQLVIGIKPAGYDEGYNAAVDRVDYFGNPATRQALAACIDRTSINNEIFNGQAELASIEDLLGNQSEEIAMFPVTFDREIADTLLEQAGWMDLDGDPTTPRVAENVVGVPAGTSLSLSLLSPTDTTSLLIASGIASSLAECGIEVINTSVPFSELFAPGPDGLVFGRAFDLALITWQYSLTPACYLYTTGQIPGGTNYWIGGNVSGYKNDVFDDTCSDLMRAIPGDGNWELLLQKSTELFLTDLPAIPLFKQPKLILAQPDLCAFSFDPFARSDLVDLEIFNRGPECKSKQ
jgi:peptide/nickel transport system substrate-binding protein